MDYYVAIFANKFFSLKGQFERIKNIGSVLSAPFTGGKVVANTRSKLLNKGLQVVANHPIATAAVVGTAANIPKAVSVIKSSRAARSVASKVTNVKSTPHSPQSPMGGLIKSASQVSKTVTSAPGTIKPANAGGLLAKAATTSTTPKRTSTRRRTASPRRHKKSRSSRTRRVKHTRRQRRSKKKHYGTAKQYARKGGKSVRYTKNGQPYIILSDGRARFVKGKRK